MASVADRDLRHYTQKMQQALRDFKDHLREDIEKDHLREDIEKVDEPQLKAMFETAAEVLGGLIKAFHDYEQKNGRMKEPGARRLKASELKQVSER